MTRYMKPIIDNVIGAAWRKSSYSNGAGGMCVEVAALGGGVAVRDSKNPTGPVLAFSAAEWDAFLAGARDGEFDRSRIIPG
ncbi:MULTISPECIES: DUF397 domain-containing protein [unclassified Frankia]